MTDPLEDEIRQTREHLADTVDALAGKAQTGVRRSVSIAVPAAVFVIVAVLVWRRRG